MGNKNKTKKNLNKIGGASAREEATKLAKECAKNGCHQAGLKILSRAGNSENMEEGKCYYAPPPSTGKFYALVRNTAGNSGKKITCDVGESPSASTPTIASSPGSQAPSRQSYSTSPSPSTSSRLPSEREERQLTSKIKQELETYFKIEKDIETQLDKCDELVQGFREQTDPEVKTRLARELTGPQGKIANIWNANYCNTDFRTHPYKWANPYCNSPSDKSIWNWDVNCDGEYNTDYKKSKRPCERFAGLGTALGIPAAAAATLFSGGVAIPLLTGTAVSGVAAGIDYYNAKESAPGSYRRGGKNNKNKKGGMPLLSTSGKGVGCKVDMKLYGTPRITNNGRTTSGDIVTTNVSHRTKTYNDVDITKLNDLLLQNHDKEDELTNDVIDIKDYLSSSEEQKQEARLQAEQERKEQEAKAKEQKAFAEAKERIDLIKSKTLKLFKFIEIAKQQQLIDNDYYEIPKEYEDVVAPETLNDYIENLEVSEDDKKRLLEIQQFVNKGLTSTEFRKRQQEGMIKSSIPSLSGETNPETTGLAIPSFSPSQSQTGEAATVTPVVTQPGESERDRILREQREKREAAKAAAMATLAATQQTTSGGKKSKKNRRNKQAGGRVLMPIQYFGGQLNRYYPAGSPQLNPLPSAYGQTVARSFGTTDPTLLKLNATAPNLGPMGLGSNGENMSCGVQTGGRRINR